MPVIRSVFGQNAISIRDVSIKLIKKTPALVGFSLSSGTEPVTLGNAVPTIIAPTSLSKGVIRYSSSNPDVATINPATGVISLIGEGDTILTASQEEHDTYSADTSSVTLKVVGASKTAGRLKRQATVTSATPTLSGLGLNVPTVVFGATAPTITKPTSLSTGAITYTSSEPAVATIDSATGVISIVGVGTTTITATQAAKDNYASATATVVLKVLRGLETFMAAGGTIGSGAGWYLSDNSDTLLWAAPRAYRDRREVRWDEANAQCASQGTGWRLPTQGELSAVENTRSTRWAMDGADVINSMKRNMWSSSRDGSGLIYSVYMYSGHVQLNRVHSINHTVCVHSRRVMTEALIVEPTVTVSLNAVRVTLGATAPTLTISSSNTGGVKTYTSNNPTVATIDSSSGVIALVSPGTVTFTVAQAASGNYAQKSVTTEVLTVEPSPPRTGALLAQPEMVIRLSASKNIRLDSFYSEDDRNHQRCDGHWRLPIASDIIALNRQGWPAGWPNSPFWVQGAWHGQGRHAVSRYGHTVSVASWGAYVLCVSGS